MFGGILNVWWLWYHIKISAKEEKNKEKGREKKGFIASVSIIFDTSQ